MFDIVLLLQVLEQLDDPVFAYINTSIADISADSHSVTLPQQRGLNLQSHVLCSRGVRLEDYPLGRVTKCEFFVGPISQAKYVIGVRVLLQLRFLLQIHLLKQDGHCIIIQVVLVNNCVQRHINKCIAL